MFKKKKKLVKKHKKPVLEEIGRIKFDKYGRRQKLF